MKFRRPLTMTFNFGVFLSLLLNRVGIFFLNFDIWICERDFWIISQLSPFFSRQLASFWNICKISYYISLNAHLQFCTTCNFAQLYYLPLGTDLWRTCMYLLTPIGNMWQFCHMFTACGKFATCLQDSPITRNQPDFGLTRRHPSIRHPRKPPKQSLDLGDRQYCRVVT